jgi:3-hydroxyisobutyrate dehydrogenase-like beta-hydroxyacid dehydrogenase
MANAAVLGLGAMGSRVAAALLKAGHPVTVWNRSKEKASALLEAGAVWSGTPQEAARNAAFVIAMVRDDEASRSVWLNQEMGALYGLQKDAIGIDSSTLTPAFAGELSAAFGVQGIAFLDAPVVGSRPQADAGQLIYLVGGEEAAVTKASPILSAMGASVLHAGPSGSGALLKLVVNTLFGVQIAAVSELIGFLQKSKFDPVKAIDLLAATPVLSPAAKGAAALMLKKAHAPLFPVQLIAKDFAYMARTASEMSAKLPIAEAAKSIFADALRLGFGDDNATSVVRLYEH